MTKRKDLIDAYEGDEVWSPMRCVRCEILIAFDVTMVPENSIRKPEWHLHAGNGMCVLCCLDDRMAEEGIADHDDLRALDILDEIVESCL